nr:cytochrome b [Haematopinus apri]
MKLKTLSMALTKEFFNLPVPSNITYLWNYGSLLLVCLVMQIVSGIFLSMHYEASMLNAFSSVVSMVNDVNWGWLIRTVHANGASFFFIAIYIHIGRGLYYGSYQMVGVWLVGVVLLFLLMATAFLGYVLPWGQMSYWGATVITNLLSAIPYFGEAMTGWLWGGFSVGNPTLVRFFSFHFVLPFVICLFVLFHLIFLHWFGSSNPLGLSNKSDMIYFHPYYSVKDVLGLIVALFIVCVVVLLFPDLFMDPDNFIEANPMNTPPHIQPEWYFLFAYSILRSIPNKLGGVVSLLASVVILALLPLYAKGFSFRFMGLKKILYWFHVMVFLMLTVLGSMPVEYPYTVISQVVALIYFVNFMFLF